MTLTLSRREACLAGTGVLFVGAGSGSSAAALVATPRSTRSRGAGDGDYLALRGAAAGRQAVLRAMGTVFVERDGAALEPAWAMEENTQVSWQPGDAGVLIERREGRLTLRPLGPWGPRKDIEIATGPVTEVLAFDSGRVVMATSARRRALIMATPVLPRDAAWQVADQPDDVHLPEGVSALRVFSQFTGPTARPNTIAWAMRSPWLSQLGPEPQGARLIWRAQGNLSRWELPTSPKVVG